MSLSTTHRRYKLVNGVHEYTNPTTKEKSLLVAGDPERDTIVSNRNLASILKNKFLDLGPVSDEEVAVAVATAIPHTTEPTDATGIPEGRECTSDFIGTVDKGLRVFERQGALKNGGGYFVFSYNPTDGFVAMNPGNVGLSPGKAQDFIGAYAPAQ